MVIGCGVVEVGNQVDLAIAAGLHVAVECVEIFGPILFEVIAVIAFAPQKAKLISSLPRKASERKPR
jgi:hypothetical protein